MRLRKLSLISLAAVIVVVVYSGITLLSLKSQTEEATDRRDELQAQVDRLTQENSELQYSIDNSTDPEIMEDVARNEIGLVLPGEKIFYDVSD